MARARGVNGVLDAVGDFGGRIGLTHCGGGGDWAGPLGCVWREARGSVVLLVMLAVELSSVMLGR